MFGDDFYPTPQLLVDRMLDFVDLRLLGAILEPSAGRGDIVERIAQKQQYGRKAELDTIEIDPELSAVLADKGYKPIASDFLAFQTYRHYDAIIMNPPFSTGDKHLLKALEIAKDGGQVVCLLNAETIRKPHTNTRRALIQKLRQYDAKIEYITDGFTSAARKTSVEVALVHVTIPHAQPSSDILANLVEAKRVEQPEAGRPDELIEGDYIRGAVRRYGLEVEAGLKLLREYDALKPMLSSSLSDGGRSIIEIQVDGDKYGSGANKFVTRLRMKYWDALFRSSEFGALFSSKVYERYRERINDLGRYEFNMSNIRQMQIEISGHMLTTLDDSIVALFDEFSNQYYDEQSNNIHYYNGWKTNKAYIVNSKVITRMYLEFYDGKLWSDYKLRDKLRDVHKVFAYLDGTLSSTPADFEGAFETMKTSCQSRKVDYPYFLIDYYKKGTVHITFKDDRLLKKFNLVGSQRKGWLPPNYGKAAYNDMTSEERQVVDEFEGRESYEETLQHRDFYLERTPLQLGMGEAA